MAGGRIHTDQRHGTGPEGAGRKGTNGPASGVAIALELQRALASPALHEQERKLAKASPKKMKDFGYPAMSERGYGWEKLISEMFCQEYWTVHDSI